VTRQMGLPPANGQQPTREAVAVMIGQLTQGGSERQLYLFLAHCDRDRWAPTVYVSGELGFWERPIRALGIPVVLLAGSRVAKMRQLRAACAAQNAKCFFSWSSYTNPFGLCLLGTGIRRVGSFRNALFADLPDRLASAWSWASLAGVSIAVCNSRETFHQLARQKILRPKAVYVPNGVEVPTMAEVALRRAQWRTRLGLREDTFLVLGVGRLVRQKRFDRFLEAISIVRGATSSQALIVGEDLGCRRDLERQVHELGLDGAVRFLGSVPDARELMCAADVFLLTSDHEGMPNVVLEAMAAGRPCVATRQAAGDVIEDGSTGLTASCHAGELARQVLRLARDPGLRRHIGAQARASIERGLHARSVTSKLWALCAQQA
jgi:glycosyltransferase involved in cell wall biosynthesis